MKQTGNPDLSTDTKKVPKGPRRPFFFTIFTNIRTDESLIYNFFSVGQMDKQPQVNTTSTFILFIR